MKIVLLIFTSFLFSISVWAQWSQTNFQAAGQQISSVVIIDNYIFVGTAYGTQDGSLFRSSDLGITWETAVSGLRGRSVSKLIPFSDGQNSFVYAATDSGVFSTTNYGDSWTELSSTLSNKFILSIYKTENYLFAGSSTKNYRSTDAGSSWVEVSIGTPNKPATDFLRTDNIIFACISATDSNIYKSEDYGLTWVPTNSNLLFTSTSSLEKLNNRLFYLTYNIMAQSTDGGNNWDIFHPVYYPSDMKSFGEYLFISSLSTGIHIMHTNSTTAINISGNIPNFLSIFVFDINAELIVAGGLNFNTSENQIWTRPTSGITSIGKNDFISDNFDLYQNYPNPFNPSTKISFKIAETRFTSLKVYDVLGNEVTTLVSQELQSGSYQFDFDAKELTSGIYFYKLQTGSFVETKKMILLK